MMQVAKRIPFEDPNVLNICRGIYIASNLIILAINIYIKITIDKKKGTFTVHVGTAHNHYACAEPARRTIASPQT